MRGRMRFGAVACAAVVLSAVPPAVAAPPEGRLFSRTAVSPTTNPRDVTLADINGDGLDDLVAAVGQNGDSYAWTWGVAVMAARAGGGFDPAVLTTTTGQPQRLQVTDTNGDGHLDVAVVQRVDDQTSNGTVLRGNVRGELMGGFDPPFGMFTDMAFGRLWDAPARQAVVATAQGLAVYRPAGSTYQRDRYIAPPGTTRLLAADLDGDGLDEVVASAANGALTLFRNLEPAATEKIGAIADLKAADATGDGVPEVIATSTSGEVLILDARFTRLRRINPTQQARSASVGDVDGDGVADVVRANEAPTASVFLAGGGAEKVVQLSAAPARVLVADGDGDGLTDVIAAETESSLIEIVEGDGAGAFPGMRGKVTTGTARWETRFADFNRDGRMDIAAASIWTFLGDTGFHDVQIHLANAQGGYSAAGALDTTGMPTGMDVADVNGDGNVDVVTTAYYESSAFVFLGNGDGTFKPRIPGPSCVWSDGVATGDFNGDGYDDAAVMCKSLIFQDHLSIMLGTPAGLVRGPSTSVSNSAQGWGLKTGDLNGDGKLDLVIGAIDHYRLNPGCLPDLSCWRVRDDRPVTYFKGLGNGLFDPTSQDFHAGELMLDFDVADVTGDGRDDIVSTLTTTDRIRISAGKADGTLAPPQYVSTYDYPRWIRAGDVDGDGHADLVVSHYSWMISVARGTGDGTFGPPAGYTARYPVADLPVMDMNGDGAKDVAAVEYDGVELFLQRT
ncbi:MAG: VCBS repeat-containing protein [Actinomycetota bacterium]|nr:VCBS repeat-containing protein [Actinomycetota bacterium]